MRRICLILIATFALTAGLMSPSQALTARKITFNGPTEPNVGAEFALNGKLTRSPQGSRVAVFSRPVGAESWTKTATVRTLDSAGNFIFKTTLNDDTPVQFQARAAKTRKAAAAASKPLTVRPKVLYVEKFFNTNSGPWTPFDVSASPSPRPGRDGWNMGFSFDPTPGAESYITWDTAGQCTTGTVAFEVGGGDSIYRVTLEADGVVLSTVEMGSGAVLARDVDVTDADKFTVRVVQTTAERFSNQRGFTITNPSFLTCASTLD